MSHYERTQKFTNPKYRANWRKAMTREFKDANKYIKEIRRLLLIALKRIRRDSDEGDHSDELSTKILTRKILVLKQVNKQLVKIINSLYI